MGGSMATAATSTRWPVPEPVARLVLVTTWASYLVVLYLLPWEGVERVLKGLLMPALLLWVLAAARGAAPRWLVLGLVLATVGDIAIDVDLVAGLVGFLLMQLAYVVGFLRAGAARDLRRRWWAAAAYATFCVGVNVALGPSLGELRLPALVYSVVICTMAALAAGMNARVGIGAALFVLSDALIAAGEAGLQVPLRSALVMPTYLLGQWCIASGWLQRTSSGRGR
jgi:uncharacterized membrane protein YhhN